MTGVNMSSGAKPGHVLALRLILIINNHFNYLFNLYIYYDVLKVQTRITQTYVASFGLRDLSQFFSNGMYMEASPL